MPGAALKRILGTCLGLALAGCAPDAGETPSGLLGEGFHFYVLALSWSPSYCLAEGESASRAQCSADASFGFIVHGLWPQFERGWPEFCDSDEPSFVPDAIVEAMADLMPSAGLVGHQWRRHGSCSGLGQEDYFRVVRAASERVTIPADFHEMDGFSEVSPQEVEAAFLAANEGMRAGGVAVTCDASRLREVRVCLDRSLAFRDCEEVDRRACSLPVVDLPPLR